MSDNTPGQLALNKSFHLTNQQASPPPHPPGPLRAPAQRQLALEIGHGRGHFITALLASWQNIELLPDLQQIPRVALARKQNPLPSPRQSLDCDPGP